MSSSPASLTTVRFAASAAILLPLLLTSACSISADKNNPEGKPDHVKISTPLGGINVRSTDVDAASLGLPEYPGALVLTKANNNGDDGQVDLHMGFGPWQMRIKVVSYGTADSQDKVVTYYRKALAKYGDVIECQGHKAVGSPSVTKEGLGCEESNSGSHTEWNDKGSFNMSDSDLELKAGSKHKQHIVGFKKSDSSQTKFALISLDLPSGSYNQQTN